MKIRIVINDSFVDAEIDDVLMNKNSNDDVEKAVYISNEIIPYIFNILKLHKAQFSLQNGFTEEGRKRALVKIIVEAAQGMIRSE